MSIRSFLRLSAHIQMLPVLESGEETLVGGQAVMEGVMMRAPHSYCVAVRKPNGEIVTEESPLPRVSEKYPIFKLPILRGLGTLGHAMFLGVKALQFSANVALGEEGTGAEKSPELSGWMMAVPLAFSLLFFLFMYKFVPLFLATQLGSAVPALHGRFAVNMMDGLIRLVIFLAFLLVLSRMKDIRRMFQVLQSVGVKVQRTSASGFMIDARDLTSVEPCPDAVRKLRASFFVIGSLLGRTGEAVVPLPGGCDIGARPIDLHVRGLEALGANVDIRQGKVHARAHNGRSLTGGTFSLDYPSVGATETLLMAAALADGHTTLSNVAQVPVPMRHTSFLHKDEDLVLSELRCWIHRVLMFDSFWYSGTGSGRSCKFFGIMWGMYTRSWNQHFEYYRNEETAWYRVPDYTRSD